MINGKDEKIGWRLLLEVNDSVMDGRGGGRLRVDRWAGGTGWGEAHLRSGVNEEERNHLCTGVRFKG